MKLVELKCQSCGAKLKRTDNSNEIKCEYCGAVTMIDDEIIKVEHSNASDSLELKFENADTYLYKLKNYAKAYELYQKLSEIKSSDPRVWSGLLRALTNNFEPITKDDYYERRYTLIEGANYYNNYLEIETDKTKKEALTKAYEAYEQSYEKTKNEIDAEAEKQKKEDNMVLITVIGIIVTLIIIAILL